MNFFKKLGFSTYNGPAGEGSQYIFGKIGKFSYYILTLESLKFLI
jgi:hypothetical protein